MTTTLFDYEKRDAPEIQCRLWIPHPVQSGSVGTIGTDTATGDTCALFLHRREDTDDRKATYNNKFNGYAISTWVFNILRARSVTKIYIAVTDEKELLEFNLNQYVDEGIPFEWREGDPQKCVPEDDALRTWTNEEAYVSDPNDTRKLRVEDKHLDGTGM